MNAKIYELNELRYAKLLCDDWEEEYADQLATVSTLRRKKMRKELFLAIINEEVTPEPFK